MDPFETYERYGVRIDLHYDEEELNPRREFEHLGIIASWSRVRFGEEDWTRAPHWTDDYGTPESIAKLREELDAGVVIPVRYEDYGSRGSRIYTAELEDANGVIYCTREKQRDEGISHQRVRKVLLGELKEYDHYLQGEVYGYVVGADTPFEWSCWGFIGDVDYVKREAEDAARLVCEAEERERLEAANAAARDIVTCS